MNSFAIMSIAYVALSACFALSYFFLLSKYYTLSLSKQVIVPIAIICDMASSIVLSLRGDTNLAFILTLVLITLAVRLCFKIPEHKNTYAVFAAVIYTLLCNIVMGILEVVVELVTGNSIYNYQQYSTIWMVIATASVAICAIFCLLISRHEELNARLKLLLNNFDLSVNVGVACTMLLICLIIASTSYFETFHDFRTNIIYLMLCMISAFMFLFLMSFGTRVAHQNEIDFKNKQMEEQLDLQMMYYKSYADYTRGLRKFQDSYKQMMANIYNMLQNKDYENIKSQIDEVNELMYRDINVQKECSNHPLLDAIMQSVGNQCRENHIEFKAKIYAPKDISLSNSALCQMFINVTHHLMKVQSSCEKPIAKYIHYESSIRDKWIIITGSCACDKKPELTHFQPVFEDILANNGGICEYRYEESKQQYSVIIGLKKG